MREPRLAPSNLPPLEVRLWDGPAPGSEGALDREVTGPVPDNPLAFTTRNVSVPTITAHLAGEPGGTAVIVCPGGALRVLSMENEGNGVASWFASRGVASYVLKYRIVETPDDAAGYAVAVADAYTSPVILADPASRHVLELAAADLARALEFVRARGHRTVALIGFSAGAHVVLRLLSKAGRTTQPDLAALVYLASHAPVELTLDGPPMFLAVAADDPLGTHGSLAVRDACERAGRPAELHLFETGGHGFGITPQGATSDAWIGLFEAWLHRHSLSCHGAPPALDNDVGNWQPS